MFLGVSQSLIIKGHCWGYGACTLTVNAVVPRLVIYGIVKTVGSTKNLTPHKS